MTGDQILSDYVRSKDLPVHYIGDGSSLYLARYTLKDFSGKGHLYLHKFYRSDSDTELHDHPWSGRSLILTGGYVEERLLPNGQLSTQTFVPGDVNVIEPSTFHRVELLCPAEGCWTLFTTSKRVQNWGFLDRTSLRFTPWQEFLQAKGRI